jgi:hypothetical protein
MFPVMPKHYDFGFSHEPCLRLSHVEEILKATRVILPIPTRQALINLIEDGTLKGHKTRYGYLVTEQSFKSYVRSLQPEAYVLRT